MSYYPQYQPGPGSHGVEPTNAELNTQTSAPQNIPYGAPGHNQLYGAQPYGGQPYGVQPYVGQGPYWAKPPHPESIAVLILGILGWAVFVTAPIALIMGLRARRDIRTEGRYSSDSPLLVGTILGGVVTGLGGLGILLFMVLIVIGVAVG